MAKQSKVLSTKSDGFVLETFFNDYIVPWYQERAVNAIVYAKARSEIDILKKRGKTKTQMTKPDEEPNAKSDELVLERFFIDYIVPWYQERVISTVSYSKAKNEIDILKQKSKQKTIPSNSTKGDKPSAESLPDDVYSKTKLKSEPTRGSSGKPYTKWRQNDTRNQPVTTAEIEIQVVLLENAEIKKKLSEMTDEKFKLMAENDVQLREKDQQLQKLRKALENTKAQVDDLTIRLRKLHEEKSHKEMSNIFVSSGSSKQREMENFSAIYDNEWSNAFESIPMKSEERKVGILHGIVKGAFLFCQQKIDEQNRTVETIILAKSNEAKRQKSSPRNEQLVQSLDDLRMQLSTETAKNVAQDFTTNLLQVIVSGAGIKQREIQQDLKTYASKCAEICWLLLVYYPNVSLSEDLENVPFDQDTYLPYTRRLSDLQQPTVDFCVWPALCRDCDVLVKGVAQPKGAKLRKPLDLQR